MHIKLRKLLLMLAVATGLVVSRVNAETLQTFSLTWSGVSFSNNAEVQAEVTFDLDLLPNPGAPGMSAIDTYITDLTMTVSGATSGNGVFGLNDFSGFIWATGGVTLDFEAELVGQSGWATTNDGANGDLNFFSSTSGVPNGTGAFTLTLGSGELVRLTSMTASAVPEPAAFASLAGAAFMGLAIARRRGRQAV